MSILFAKMGLKNGANGSISENGGDRKWQMA